MKSWIVRILERIRASYWFVPSVMSAGALLLAAVTLQVEPEVSSRFIERFPWLAAGTRDGARALLTTVAGSVITVAGVAFSITMVAVVHAASQFGPRLLLTFMRDRANQVTLGTFIATFVYCLVVLSTLRDEAPDTDEARLGLAVLIGLALCAASLAAFIFFLHHAPESIHVSNVVARVGRELRKRVEDAYAPPPSSRQDDDDDERELPGTAGAIGSADERKRTVRGGPDSPYPESESGRPRRFGRIAAGRSGYVQVIDMARLIDIAREHDRLITVKAEIGGWAFDEKPLALVEPDGLDSHAEASIRRAFVIGRHRSHSGAITFNTDQLVEITGRALSPGINDPFTAQSCMDWLASSLAAMSGRRPPERVYRDREGRPRVVVGVRRFEDQASEVFDRTRPYIAPDRNASLHVLALMADLAEVVCPADRARVVEHADALAREALEHLTLERDRRAVENAYRKVAGVGVSTAPSHGSAVVDRTAAGSTNTGVSADPSR